MAECSSSTHPPCLSMERGNGKGGTALPCAPLCPGALSTCETVRCPCRPCQLPLVRHTEPEYAVGYETRFSDGYPMLLVTSAALEDLNSHLAPKGEQLPMNRFRPNIEVSVLHDSGTGSRNLKSFIAALPRMAMCLRLD